MLGFRGAIGAAGLLALLAGHGSLPVVGSQGAGRPAGRVHHAMQVFLEPETQRLGVSATVTIPEGRTEFLLNARLAIRRPSVPVDEVPLGNTAVSAAPLKRYRIRGTPATLTFEYAGPMDFGLSDEKEQYTRGFRRTPGIVSEDGVYLAGDSFWYPHFGDDLVTFELTVALPRGWHVVSQGYGTARNDLRSSRWTSRDPTDEIYLVGGPLTVYRDFVAAGSGRDTPGHIETLVYLRDSDDALASRYLAATAQYLEMYSKLIGPYPYEKFALVENFWETGYGMPSFTLLGREVIRLPFILHSSYPHEILHNWWGNSVFVDYGSGNWAEGLTAYLADHLVQEQRGRGADHRRAALQKYRAYVWDGRDFALTEFRSRDSAATEAVGYGKTMMVFHMLRRTLGDERFIEMLRALYREHRWTRASWQDVERISRESAAADLGGFFAQWTRQVGAPALEVRDVRAVDRGGRRVVSGTLVQTQDAAAYALDVPVVLQTAQGQAAHRVTMSGRTAAFEIPADEAPLMLHVDPYFDLFRRIDPRETPPSISQLFGEPRIVAVLPSKAPPAQLAAYRRLLKGWETVTHRIDVRLDSELKALPQGSSVWLVGRENAWVPALFGHHPGVAHGAEPLRFDGRAVPASNHSAVALVRHPGTPDSVVGWLFVDPIEAMAGLGRKLPHYGRYSYVAFSGAEPDNIFSGEWQVSDSPLRVDVRPAGDRGRAIPGLPPDPAKALAEPRPVDQPARVP